jgi:GNAT superfamily N-acetyltransferase
VIRRITLRDVDVFRETRLRALADSPSSFGSTYAAEVNRSEQEWIDRGSGVAAELVEAVLGWAADCGARTIALWVTKGNVRAQRFYERMGFTLTGDTQPLPSDPCKDELRMVRKL